MTDLFKTYEQEFISSLSSTSKKIQNIPVQSNQKKQMGFVDIKEDITECERTLKLMETQLNSFDVTIRFEYSRKVRGYKKDFDDCRKKLYKAEEEYAYEKNRQMLMGAQLDEEKSSRQREKLLKNGQQLSDANEHLKNSVRVMYETEQISNNVQIELGNHTERMKQNKEKLLEMRDDLGHSEHKIKSIMMRIRKNKLILGGVIGGILLIGIIVLLIKLLN